jgi:hypothetical protein
MASNSGIKEWWRMRAALRGYANGLGSTAEEIAERMEREGVRGIPGNAAECAIARHCQAIVGSETAVRRVVVRRESIRLYLEGRRLGIRVLLPRACSAFIGAFDAGCYPQLVDPSAALREHAGSAQPLAAM